MIGVTGCVSSSTKIDIFWLDTGGGIGHNTGTGTGWGVPGEELGGEFVTVPAAVATNSPQFGFPELVDVFAVEPDFAMYSKQSAQGTWAGDWLDLQGDFACAAGVISRLNGQLDVFAVGNDYAMYHRFRTGLGPKTRWSPGWEYLGGRFISTASVVSRDGVSIDVFARVPTSPSGTVGTSWARGPTTGRTSVARSHRRPLACHGGLSGWTSSRSAPTARSGTAGGTGRSGTTGSRSVAP